MQLQVNALTESNCTKCRLISREVVKTGNMGDGHTELDQFDQAEACYELQTVAIDELTQHFRLYHPDAHLLAGGS